MDHNNGHPTRVGIYARVSTRHGGQDLDTQLLPLRRYALDRGWKIVGEWQDQESGGKEDRIGLAALMNAARKRQLDAVLVFRFDRFARSTRQLLGAMDELRSLGVDFVSYSENIDTSSPAGQVMFTIISAFAEFERTIIRERVCSGLARARQQGTRLGRPPIRLKLRDQVLALKQQGLPVRQVAQMVGVSSATVSRIRP